MKLWGERRTDGKAKDVSRREAGGRLPHERAPWLPRQPRGEASPADRAPAAGASDGEYSTIELPILGVARAGTQLPRRPRMPARTSAAGDRPAASLTAAARESANAGRQSHDRAPADAFALMPKQAGEPPAPSRPRVRAWLIQVEGPEPDHIDQVRDGVTWIGREARNDIRLDDVTVSGQHAKLWVDGSGVLRLLNISTTNVTRVNGVPVEAPVAIEEDDEIALGAVTLVLKRVGGPRPRACGQAGPQTDATVSLEVGRPQGSPQP